MVYGVGGNEKDDCEKEGRLFPELVHNGRLIFDGQQIMYLVLGADFEVL